MEALRCLQLQQFHSIFLDQKKRSDGRSFNEFRPIDVTAKPVDSADGSFSLRLGNTCVLTGVKGKIEEPNPSDPAKGMIEVTCKLPPNALHDFKWSRDSSADQEIVLSSRLKDILTSSGCLDLSQLVIQEEKHVWSLEVEVIVLDFDGNIFDSCLACIIGCLAFTSLPKVEVGQETDNPVDQFIFKEERIPLKLKSFPFSTTIAIFEGGILLVDPTVEEESLSRSSLEIVVSHPDHLVVSLSQYGEHTIPDDKMLDKIDVAFERSLFLYNKVINGQE